MFISPPHAASGPFTAGQINPICLATAPIAADRTPLTPVMVPSNASSPMTIIPSTLSDGTAPIATSNPSAIGRSKCDPSLIRSAGARLTAIRFGGNDNPSEDKAARTLSLDSLTALSASPTIAIFGRPFDRCTCT